MHTPAPNPTIAPHDTSARSVDLMAWPAEADRLAERRRTGRSSLLVVDPGAPIPSVAEGEDWIRRDADERDVAARLAHLARSRPSGGRPSIPVPLVLRAGTSAAVERLVARLLQGTGRLVTTADLAAATHLGTATDGAAVAALVAEARAALPAGWELLAIGSAGHLLQQTPGAEP